ncbi:MAG: DUF1987 domain-containing protein [Flavobacteriia bacterium]|nr:DUF1987 domain-containing protein [Flavobacteriia bacterium]
MENIIREGSAKTPSVSFNSVSGVLELKGRSIPENSVEFYKPLNDWIDSYSSSPCTKTVVDIKLEYFNTSSSKCILDLFKKLESLKHKGTEVQVNWYYEEDDEDMEEAGEDYQAIIKLPFNMIEVQEI